MHSAQNQSAAALLSGDRQRLVNRGFVLDGASSGRDQLHEVGQLTHFMINAGHSAANASMRISQSGRRARTESFSLTSRNVFKANRRKGCALVIRHLNNRQSEQLLAAQFFSDEGACVSYGVLDRRLKVRVSAVSALFGRERAQWLTKIQSCAVSRTDVFAFVSYVINAANEGRPNGERACVVC